MKRSLFLWIIPVCAAASMLGGCSGNGAAAEDANKAIQAMSPEQRFERIKSDKALSSPMKERAIDNLPVSDDQKGKWKAEIKSQPG